MISTTCALFNTVVNAESPSSREERIQTIIHDDFVGFIACCREVLNDESVKNVTMVVKPGEKGKVGHYNVEKI